MSFSAVAILPARLESSRLPRKPVLDICGLPMIVHVYRRCKLAEGLTDVIVATDSNEIFDLVQEYGGKAVMTSRDHETGTDRIAEVARNLSCDVVVNVQGDEALLNPQHVTALVSLMRENREIEVSIVVNPFSKYNSPSDIKTVLDEQGNVLYFSRNDIPSSARTANAPMLKAYHIVPFRRDFLLEYSGWEKGYLERIEFNEYLRILEKGRKMRALKVESSAVSVDTPEDLELVRSQMLSDPIFPLYSN